MARLISTVTLLFMLALPVAALSEDAAKTGDAAAAAPGSGWDAIYFPPAQHFTLDPVLFTYLGYRFTGLTGSRRAAEYDYLHDSVAGGFDLHYYPLPFMVDMDFDYKNENDHNADVTLRFTDMVKVDFRSMELFHNMDHYAITSPAGIVPDADTDPNRQYGVDVNDNELKLVLKSPDRPYHLYVDLREFRKDGTVQQRFIFLNSVSRDIDWVTRELTAGINGNILGFLELDYHHTIKTFDSKVDSIIGPDTFFVEGNAVPLLHNQISDLKSNTDTISLHTDQGRPLSAAGTFSWGDKKNKFSGATVKFLREYGDVTYRPLDNLFLALKYGHQKLEVKNPDTMAELNFATPAAFVDPTTPIRDSIQTRRDKGMFAVSYYPVPKLMLLGKYELDAVKRGNVDQWNDDVALESLNFTRAYSITHKGTVSASFSPARRAKLRASFSYSHSDNPSRISDYRSAYEGYVWGNWVPSPGLTFNAQYKLLRGENPVSNPGVDGQDGFTPIAELNRHVQRDNAGAGVTWLSPYGLVFGAHYDFLRLRLTQNIIFNNGDAEDSTAAVFSFATPYRDQTHEYTVFTKYCFRFPLSLEASFSQSWSKGNYTLAPDLFGPGVPTPTEGIASLVDQKIRETRGELKARYEIWKGWGTALLYGISNFKDLQPRLYTGSRNGTAHYGSALLTKRW
jgi:hypothetical protein